MSNPMYSKLRLKLQLLFLSASAYEKKALYIIMVTFIVIFSLCAVFKFVFKNTFWNNL